MVVTAMTSRRNMNASLGRTAPMKIMNHNKHGVSPEVAATIESNLRECRAVGNYRTVAYSSSSSEGGSTCSMRSLQIEPHRAHRRREMIRLELRHGRFAAREGDRDAERETVGDRVGDELDRLFVRDAN